MFSMLTRFRLPFRKGKKQGKGEIQDQKQIPTVEKVCIHKEVGRISDSFPDSDSSATTEVRLSKGENENDNKDTKRHNYLPLTKESLLCKDRTSTVGAVSATEIEVEVVREQLSIFSWPEMIRKTVSRVPVWTEMLLTTRQTRSNSQASTQSASSFGSCSQNGELCPDQAEGGDCGYECDGGGEQDPITLGPLEEPVYTYQTPCGRQVRYGLVPLVQYLLRTGEMRDPVTRYTLSTGDLAAIDRAVAEASSPAVRTLASVKEAAGNSEFYLRQSQSDCTVRGLEACLGEIIVEILAQVETVAAYASRQRAEMQISVLFTEFDAPFAELKRLDLESAYHAHRRWVVFLRGPARRPTANPMGILDFAIRLLDSHWSESNQEDLLKIRTRHEFGGTSHK